MAGFTIEVGIRKAIRVVKDAEVLARREKILNYTAGRIQANARANSRKKMGDIAPGRVTGRLEESIKISEPEKSPSGRSVALRVYADTAMTRTDAGSYASFQELGTGEYSEAPGATGQPIMPKHGAAMTWIQKGKPYRGRFVAATPTRIEKIVTAFKGKRQWRKPRGGGKPRHSYLKRTSTEWQQIAWEIHGDKPKHYMRDAATKQILADHTRLIRESAIRDIVEVIG